MTMSDDEVSQASSPYTSEAEEEELELEDFADQEAEAEAEEAEAELEGEAEGEGEQAEESEEDDEGDSDEESEEEEEEGEDDDAEGDEDDEEAADLEAALENMEAMDDEPQDEDEPMKPVEDVPAIPDVKPETPAQKRRGLFVTNYPYPKSYGIDPICALPHPVATDSLASSLCMTYLVTGSQDGFIRCYDFFASVNNKTFLTAPQRAHCGIAEGNMKAGVLKFWWENWAPPIGPPGGAAGSQDKTQGEEKTLSAVHSMVLQADALWGLSGTEQWDLNTGQMVRTYGTPRNSGGNTQEVVSLGLRPLTPLGTATNPHSELFSGGDTAAGMLPSNKSGTTLGHDRDGDDDGDSGSSDDSLFGDDSGDDEEGGGGNQKKGASKPNGVQAQNSGPNATRSNNHSNSGGPILSPDIVMTAYIDGQVLLWDRRNPTQSKPLRLEMGEKSPPWCVSASWSSNGHEIYAGRRIGTIDVWDIRQAGASSASGPRLLKSLRNPASSGPVTCVAGFPDGQHLVWTMLPMDNDAMEVELARSRSQSISGTSSPSNSDSDDPRSGSPSSVRSLSSTSTVSSDREEAFFRDMAGRKLNTMNVAYTLPSDSSEIKRLDQEHRMLKFVLNSNYVGNIKDVLASTKEKDKRIMDCGTGSGLWCIEVAEEFPQASVVGVDLAPIQPRFELFDLDGQQLPYPDGYFDVIHCRSVYMGIRNYPLFLRECARVLRRNGMIILAEADSQPLTDNKRIMAPEYAQGWTAFWTEYRKTLGKNGFDVSIPTRLRGLLQEIPSLRDNVVAQEALVPIGTWPKDPLLLTIGQLSWMNQDNLLFSLIPTLVGSGMSEAHVKKLIEAAQKDLYYPQIRPYVCWHFAHARKTGGR
ncbi:hypothetical protein FRC04_011094 [Tulasnella sp. 424]|nr:hypothetical protein FRC04_011094 [Tulasnella sp. 424]